MRRSVRITAEYTLLAVCLTAAILLFSVPVFTRRTAKSVNARKTLPLRVTVILDAGHGGEDGGAEANGVREKDVNLDIVRQMRAFLLLSGVDVRLTRTDDRLLYDASVRGSKKKQDIDNRVSFASSFENGVFVSIHQNRFGIAKYKGLQVYYSANAPWSKSIAEKLQSADKAYLEPENTRQIKQADRGIRVLHELTIPAVLVECGFLSNPSDAAKLSDEAYRKKLSFVLSMTLLDTLGRYGA